MRERLFLLILAALAAPFGEAGAPSLGPAWACATVEEARVDATPWAASCDLFEGHGFVLPAPPPLGGVENAGADFRVPTTGARPARGSGAGQFASARLRSVQSAGHRLEGVPGAALLGFAANPSTAPPLFV